MKYAVEIEFPPIKFEIEAIDTQDAIITALEDLRRTILLKNFNLCVEAVEDE